MYGPASLARACTRTQVLQTLPVYNYFEGGRVGRKT